MKAISIDKPRSVGIIDVAEPKAGEEEVGSRKSEVK